MALAAPGEERQVGVHVIPAAVPDWAAVLKKGCSLLEQSRDLRVLAKVCRAAVHQYGLIGLDQAMALMAFWVENQWDDIHPRLNIDGEFDPLLRSNAIADFADPAGVVFSLRQAVFIKLPVGTVSVSAADQLLNGLQMAGQEIVPSLEKLAQMIAEEEEKNLDRFTALASIQASLTRIVSTFHSRLNSEYWPNIDLLTGVVSRLVHFVTATLNNTAPEPPPQLITAQAQESIGLQESASAATGPGGCFPAKLQTRAEAFKALSLARKYFENNEPSHPAPLLIRRIERLASMDFFQIIQELTPDGIKQLHSLTGDSENSKT
ncbi:MAG: type VI secretion system ImpA family N-terminal domain-containing protein [Betaproteobacteria bacterium]|nr:type VI secretion system ImpA family N-terminal domain-containing protein [Betaproteobacteria bacterium]